jgi:hypothetical protein
MWSIMKNLGILLAAAILSYAVDLYGPSVAPVISQVMNKL